MLVTKKVMKKAFHANKQPSRIKTQGDQYTPRNGFFFWTAIQTQAIFHYPMKGIACHTNSQQPTTDCAERHANRSYYWTPELHCNFSPNGGHCQTKPAPWFITIAYLDLSWNCIDRVMTTAVLWISHYFVNSILINEIATN